MVRFISRQLVAKPEIKEISTGKIIQEASVTDVSKKRKSSKRTGIARFSGSARREFAERQRALQGKGTIINTITDTKSGKTTVRTTSNTGKVTTKTFKTGKGVDPSRQQIIRATLKPGDLTFKQKFLTPTKKDKPVTRAAKGVGAFIVDIGKGTLELAKKFDPSIRFRRDYEKSLAGDKQAKFNLKQKFTNLKTGTLTFGAGIGQQLQSTDPFFKVQGLLTLASLVGGPKITKSQKANVLFAESKYSSKVNLASKSAKTIIKTTGVLEDGTKFKAITTLRHNPGQKTIIGQVKTTVKGKTSTKKVNLKDLGTTLVDSKTRKPVAKDFRTPKSIKYNIDELKTTTIGRDRTRIAKGEVIVTGKRGVTSKQFRGEIKNGVPKPEVVRTKSAVIDFATDFKGKPTDVLTVRKNIQAQLNKLKKKDLQNLKAKDLKTLENKLNNKVRTVIKRKGTAKAKGEFEDFGAFQVSFGPTRKLKANFKPLSNTKKNNLGKIPKGITIPKLKFKIKLAKKFRLRGMLAPSVAQSFISKFNKKVKQLEKGKLKEKVKTKLQPKKKVPVKATKKAKSQKKAKKPATKVKQATKPISKPVAKVKPTTKIKVASPRPRLKPKAKVKVPLPFFKLSFRTKVPRGFSRKVDGFVKVGRKKVKVVSGLPINKAWNKIFSKGTRKFRGVDGSVARSFEFKVVGLTKAKDDRTMIGKKKTTARIGKDPKVLNVVEKVKHAIDTKGEKKGLKLAKKKKPKKKTPLKRKRKVSVIKKKKKSSKIKRKTIKRKKR